MVVQVAASWTRMWWGRGMGVSGGQLPYEDGMTSSTTVALGGGWCESTESCLLFVNKTNGVGSSKLMNKFRFSGVFSKKQSQNPGFYNWNRVIMRYCDGASFTGDVEKVDPATNLHYRGARIFNAIMKELLAKGLNNASNALLTGCSSGGLAAILYCDKFRAMLPATSRVKCVPDAGYLVHVKDISGKYHFQKFFNKIIKLHNSKINLPTSCTSKMKSGLCFYPQFILPEIKTPVFVINSAYDSYQVQNILAPEEADRYDSWSACKLNTSNCSRTQLMKLYGHYSKRTLYALCIVQPNIDRASKILVFFQILGQIL
ncbi:putative pectinacetylesterase/NOTUM [Helianthus annuus]|nr:putative pectinacetylesterase/NOTUM [Helianthus annuus]